MLLLRLTFLVFKRKIIKANSQFKRNLVQVEHFMQMVEGTVNLP